MILRKIGRVKRIVFSFTLAVTIAPIVLNFIPIKFAVRLEDAQKNLGTGKYICVTEFKYVPDTGWIAESDLNSHLKRNLPVRVSGNSPNNYLSEREFDFKWFDVENRFLLVGAVERFEKDKENGTGIIYANLNVNHWEVIYPINRASIRQYITPKSYLNIYDYDLRKVIRKIWGKAS